MNTEAKFVWADLSTFNLEEAQRFYGKCFGWKFHSLSDGYYACGSAQSSSAGLYVMPEKFQNIRMPSFWMSYIQVHDIEETVRVAKANGAIIEVSPEPAPGGGLVALIRDPAGAGFTCYEGDAFGGNDIGDAHGSRVWHELHVSDISVVEPFYSAVFGWKITRLNEPDRYLINDQSGVTVAGVRVTSNELKGDKEYWGVYFSVDDLAVAIETIQQCGGEIVAEQALGERHSVLAYDNQGAAFYVGHKSNDSTAAQSELNSTIKWRAIAGLIVVALAFVLNINWIWGVLFLLWVIPDINKGSTYFFDHIDRRHNPIIFWLVVATWVVLSGYFFFY